MYCIRPRVTCLLGISRTGESGWRNNNKAVYHLHDLELDPMQLRRLLPHARMPHATTSVAQAGCLRSQTSGNDYKKCPQLVTLAINMLDRNLDRAGDTLPVSHPRCHLQTPQLLYRCAIAVDAVKHRASRRRSTWRDGFFVIRVVAHVGSLGGRQHVECRGSF
jgi:hypothetical protein